MRRIRSNAELLEPDYLKAKPKNRKRTISERGWLGAVIDDHLRPALHLAEQQLSDLDKLALCDDARCGRMFDSTDPRGSTWVERSTTYRVCPGCTLEQKNEPG